MKKKILVISKENPFPVRDGISAAIGSFVLRVEHQFEVCFFIDNVFFQYRNKKLYEVKTENNLFYDFDIYVTSPIILSFKNNFKLPNSAIKIALLSDCYTNVLWVNIKLAVKFGYLRLKTLKDLLKIPFYYVVELLVSIRYDYILMQTPKDVSIFKKLFFSKKVIDLPNITTIENTVQSVSLKDRNGIGWVASFKGSYLNIAKVFFDKVLTKVLSEDSMCKVYFLGKGSDVFVDYLLKKYPCFHEQLIKESFHPEIKEFYLKRKIIVSPVFKNYGLINKTVESLTYGCITIGDKGAFNGIVGFVDGEHGFVANTFEEFILLIQQQKKMNGEDMSTKATALIHTFNKKKLYPKQFIKMMNI